MGIPEKQSVSWFFTDTLRKRLSSPTGSAYRFRVDLYRQSYWSGSENTCFVPDCTAQTVTIQTPQGQPAEQAITDNLAGNRLEMTEVDEAVNLYTGGASSFWMTGCHSANLLSLFAESIVADNQEFKKIIVEDNQGKRNNLASRSPKFQKKASALKHNREQSPGA